MLLMVTACGGGSGGSSRPPVGNNLSNDDTDDRPEPGGPLAHCAASTGVFSNVTDELGLCYEVTGEAVATEIEELGGGLALADIDGDGLLELYVALGQQQTGRLFSFDGTRFNQRQASGIAPSAMDLAPAISSTSIWTASKTSCRCRRPGWRFLSTIKRVPLSPTT